MKLFSYQLYKPKLNDSNEDILKKIKDREFYFSFFDNDEYIKNCNQ